MKTLLLLLLIVSCGKSVNRTPKAPEHFSLLVEESRAQKIPSEVIFKTADHLITFKSPRGATHEFFEAGDEIVRFYAFELTHLETDALYHVETSLPENLELYLYDKDKKILIDPSNMKFSNGILERLRKRHSFLAIHLTKDQYQTPPLVIRNFKTNETLIRFDKFKDYLSKQQIEVNAFSLNDLFKAINDNEPRWWLKKDSSSLHKLIYASPNELNESFKNHYQYNKQSIKRINGKGIEFSIENARFLRISAKQTLQKQVIHQFKQTYYTQKDELPYPCLFQEAQAQQDSERNLTSAELKQLLRINRFIGSWDFNHVASISLKLLDLDSGFFNVGIISRQCAGSMGPRVNMTPVNEEKELELVIESYGPRVYDR